MEVQLSVSFLLEVEQKNEIFVEIIQFVNKFW